MKRSLAIWLILVGLAHPGFAATFLKEGASVTVQIGPFVDAVDGVTPEVGLATTIGTDARLSKAGGAFGTRNSTTAPTYDTAGFYQLHLDDTDTNTSGELIIQCSDPTTYLPVWHRFTVVPENVYDSLVLGNHPLPTVDATGYNNVFHVGSEQQYTTIADAEATAGAGDLIVVHPGTYLFNSPIGKLDVTYWLCDGAVLQPNGINTDAFANVARFAVRGHGRVIQTTLGRVINAATSNADIAIQLDRLDVIGDASGFVTGDASAQVDARVRKIVSTQANALVQGTGQTLLQADAITLLSSLASPSSGGRVDIQCRHVLSSSANLLAPSSAGVVRLSGLYQCTAGTSNGINAPSGATVIADRGAVVVPSGRPSLSGSGTIVVSDAFAYDTASATATNIVKTTAGKIDAYLPDAAPGATNGLLIAGNNASMSVNITGNLTGSVGSVTGAVGSVAGNVGGNINGTVGGFTTTALADLFDTDSGQMYSSAVAGSVVKEIADHATTPLLTASGIADAVLDELLASHTTPGSLSKVLSDVYDFLNGAPTFGDAMDTQGYTTALASKLDANVDAKISELPAQMPSLLASTTIQSLTSQTTFILAAGPPDEDALNGAIVVVTDQSTAAQKAVGLVKDYVGSSRTVTLVTDPQIFNFASGDRVDVIATGSPAALWLGGSP